MHRFAIVVIVALWLLGSAGQAEAGENWEFSVGAFGGKAYHAETTARVELFDVDVKGRGLKFDDSPTYGAKLTAWYLPRKYNWSPQIGLELDWTRYTADLQPQTVSLEGGGEWPLDKRVDFSVNNLAASLLFRYPILATPEMPHGRWYPYVGIGTGVQRAHMSMASSNDQETSYSPLLQGLVGAKFFLINNLALFAEWKWTQGWHSFNCSGLGFSNVCQAHVTLATSNIVGGVALHF